jgi:hypothetical protein
VWQANRRIGARFPEGEKVSLLIYVFRPEVKRIKWVPKVLSPVIKDRGAKLITNVHLVSKLRMRGAIPPNSCGALLIRGTILHTYLSIYLSI